MAGGRPQKGGFRTAGRRKIPESDSETRTERRNPKSEDSSRSPPEYENAQPRGQSRRLRGPKAARRPPWAVLGERAFEVLIYLCGISAIVFVLGIFFFVFKEAFLILGSKQFSLREFLFSDQWYPTSEVHKRYGVLAMIAGTFSVTALAMVIAVPFGLGAAIYLSEFCGRDNARNAESGDRAAGGDSQRSVGFIGLTVMSRLIVKYTGAPVGVNVLNGGIILALMSVPIIVSIGEDALKAVPDSYREAGLALGATRWHWSGACCCPPENGLLAAVLLGVGRGVGETMAVLMATGHAVHIPHSVFDSVRTLTANIAAELGEAPASSDHYQVLFLTGVLLFLMTFVSQSRRGSRRPRH